MRNRWWILLLCWPLAVVAQAADVQQNNKALLVMESPYNFEETVSNLRDAIGNNNFRMIREQAWDDGLKSRATSSRDAILYFCNFDMVNRAIKMDRRVGQLLPFRLTVTEQDNRVFVMAINPEVLTEAMGNSSLGSMHIASRYRQIIDEGLF